jgi:hypothetical protein
MLLLIGLIATSYTVLNKETRQGKNKQFYVGVTYCGSSVQEAKELIDQVKNYTNLFVLQSGPLMLDSTAMDEIGDYACASNLNYAISGSTRNARWIYSWLSEAKEKWGEQFIGIYYTDEPGGNMLDGQISPLINTVKWTEDGELITESFQIDKGRSGEIIMYQMEVIDETMYMSITKYFPNGTISIGSNFHRDDIIYYPNRTITAYELNPETGKYDVYTSENNITQYSSPIQPYEQVLKQNLIQTSDNAAEAFVNMNKKLLDDINKTQLQEESILVFTADYGLYWWDYKGGFDVVLAELGWNHTTSQDIGLARGAANLQNKSWGAVITWKYTHAPYLTDGKEMFEQMKTSYQAGAEYVLIFNYSEDPENPNTLQEEHFQALERFWNDVVQNPKIKHGNIKANAVLVLPQNYGWGMRHQGDKIWGIWPADDKSQVIWSQLQDQIDNYGPKIDIIYEDPDYPVVGRYNQVYYWDQK